MIIKVQKSIQKKEAFINSLLIEKNNIIKKMKIQILILMVTLCCLSQSSTYRLLSYDDPLCSQWNSDGSVCLHCAFHAFFNESSSLCQNVNDYCKTWNDTDGSCFTCFDGYGTSERNGLAIDGECPLFDGNFTTQNLGYDINCQCFEENRTCQNCYVGFAFNQNGICQQAPLNCIQIANSTCVKCKAGFQLIGNDTCQSLTSSCLITDSQGNCIQCINGTMLNSVGKCVVAIDNCATQNQNGKCTKCNAKYSLSSNGKNCIKLIAGCITMNQHNICSLCRVGHFLNNQGTCEKLPENCVDANQAGICVECSATCYLTTDKICKPLPQNCKMASPTGKCQECVHDFVIRNGKCKNKIIHNKTLNCAQKNSKEECVRCQRFYILKNGQCHVMGINPFCSGNACQCGTDQCIQCQVGYFLDNNRICQKISQNCLSYSIINGSCLTCRKQFTLVSGECVPTSNATKINLNCRLQSNSGVCTQCRKYYRLQTGHCIPTGLNPKCRVFQQDTCILCYYPEMYYLDNNNICSHNYPNCKQINVMNGECTSCDKEYTLSKGQCLVKQA